MSATTRQEILNLLANGKISADEAANLLNQVQTDPQAAETAETFTTVAGDVPAEVEPEAAAKAVEPAVKSQVDEPSAKSGKKPTWFRVRVSNLDTGKSKVTVNIPIRMLKFGFTIASRFTPELESLDWDEVNAMMAENATGMLVDVQDEESNEHVQVYID